jgi:membrane protein
VLSILFEWITSRFGGFDALYGSLSTIIGFMVWIWLSTIVVLFGAEFAAVAERNADPSARSPAPSLDSSSARSGCKVATVISLSSTRWMLEDG